MTLTEVIILDGTRFMTLEDGNDRRIPWLVQWKQGANGIITSRDSKTTMARVILEMVMVPTVPLEIMGLEVMVLLIRKVSIDGTPLEVRHLVHQKITRESGENGTNITQRTETRINKRILLMIPQVPGTTFLSDRIQAILHEKT